LTDVRESKMTDEKEETCTKRRPKIAFAERAI